MAKLTTFGQLKAAMVKAQNGVAEVAQAAADALDELDGMKADKAVFGTIVIQTTGWAVDNAIAGFKNSYDIAIAGLTAADRVAVTVYPECVETAKAAGFTVTESYAGKLRLRAAKVPTAPIKAEYHIIR